MMRRLSAALLAVAGIALIAVSQFGIAHHVVAPVPIQNLGLPPEAVAPFREFVASLPPLQIVGAASDQDNQRQRVVLDSHLLRVGGGTWPWHGPQQTGDCAAQAIAGAIEIDTAVQSEIDRRLMWRAVNRGAIYGGGRVTIGKGAIRGDGLVPSWGLQYVDEFGILWQDEPGVPPYSGAQMNDWGRNGVPTKFLALMKPFAGLQYARCSSAQDVCNAINAGHPVPFGSMQWGTDLIKLIEGRNVAFDTTNWPHAQIVTGYDGTLKNGQRLFRVLNSWGPNAHTPQSQMPGDHPGAYYITWETMDQICREGMTFALSGSNGFRKRRFVPDFSVIGAADPDPVVREEIPAMFPLPPSFQLPGTVLGGVLLLLALVWWLFRGNGLRRVGAVALLAAVSLPRMAAAQAPNFEALTRAAQPMTVAATGKRPIPRFEGLTAAAKLPPPPTATSVCMCGCGKTGCACLQRSTPAKAVKAEVTLWTYPGCGPCQTLKATLAKIDALQVHEVSEAGPVFTYEKYPVLTMPGKVDLVGTQSAETVKRWAGVP